MGVSIDSEAILVLGIPITIVLMSIGILIKIKKGKRIFWVRESTVFLLLVYLMLLIGLTLCPIDVIWDKSVIREINLGINLIPFKDIINNIGMGNTEFSAAFDMKMLLMNVGGNIFLLLPLGFLAPMLWRKFRNLKNCFILGVITALSIEFLQFLEVVLNLSYRTIDIDDLILNVLGIITGYLLYRVVLKIKPMKEIPVNKQSQRMKIV